MRALRVRQLIRCGRSAAACGGWIRQQSDSAVGTQCLDQSFDVLHGIAMGYQYGVGRLDDDEVVDAQYRRFEDIQKIRENSRTPKKFQDIERY